MEYNVIIKKRKGVGTKMVSFDNIHLAFRCFVAHLDEYVSVFYKGKRLWTGKTPMREIQEMLRNGNYERFI